MKRTPANTDRWWKPGESGNPAGRPKGAVNHFNRDIRDMIEHALHKAGGVDYLAEQAHKNPSAFLGLVGRVLPMQLAGQINGDTPGALHLLAATLVSEAIISALGDGETKPPPPQIEGKPENVLDSPKPTE